MTRKERYKNDPDFRAKVKQAATTWAKEKAASDPRYKRIFYLRVRIRLHKRGKIKKPRTPVEALQQELHALCKEVHAELTLRPKKPRKNRFKMRGRTWDQVLRGRQQHEANMLLSQHRKEAKRELNEFMAAWKAKWEPIIGVRRRNLKRGTRKRRDKIIEATKKFGDHALTFQIQTIRRGPCKCYWCGLFLPDGGTVDHIIALANGGTHTSGNVCAACSKCNTLKSDNAPEEVGLFGTLC